MRQFFGHLISALTAGIFCLLLSTPAATSADQGACSEDIAKFCSDTKSGRAAILYCLKAHENELSVPCKQHMAVMSARREKMKEYPLTCKDDISRFCKDVSSAKGALHQCLKEHKDQLSAACKEEIITKEERIQKAKEFYQACKDDVKRLCADKRSKRLGSVKCLNENEDKLSAPCKEFMDKSKPAKEDNKSE